MDVTSQSFDRQLAVKIDDPTIGPNIKQGIGGVNLGVKIGETYYDMSQEISDRQKTSTIWHYPAADFYHQHNRQEWNDNDTLHARWRFHCNQDGYLVTKDGDYVLAEGGNRIQIPNANLVKISVNQAGEIYSGNTYVAKLQLVDFQSYDALSSYGENMYEAVNGAVQTQADATVNQGYLEMSNVNMVTEMVDMIAVTRAYETNQKMVQTIDQTLDKAVNEIGRL